MDDMQILHRKAPAWIQTLDFLDVRQQCQPLFHHATPLKSFTQYFLSIIMSYLYTYMYKYILTLLNGKKVSPTCIYD